eukprot:13705090-Alexandrium_andersonii.AAC.1
MTAPGPDGWTYGEMRAMPNGALRGLARMLNRIESGAKWPCELLKARMAYLAKGQTLSLDALQYR